jgi:hypothetical protein
LGDIPAFLDYPINFYFNAGALQRAIAALPGSTLVPKSLGIPLASSNGHAPEPARL